MNKLTTLHVVAASLLICTAASAQVDPYADRVSYGHPSPTNAATLAGAAELHAKSVQSMAVLNKALAALARNDKPKAIALLREAIALSPLNADARLRLADIYTAAKRPAEVISDLNPIVEPDKNTHDSVGEEPTTRMVYLLALLDTFQWDKAVACYEASIKPGLQWQLPGGGPEHSFPEVIFSTTNPDIPGMRAQAHLILGAKQSHHIEVVDAAAYMLPHIEEVLRVFPGSLDARFLKAVLLAKMERFDEAGKAFAVASKNAPKPALDEIKSELAKMEVREQQKKLYEATLAGKPDKP